MRNYKFYLMFILSTLILIIFITSSPLLKNKFFLMTHSNWVKVNNFNIIETYTYCSSEPWRRGIDRAAYRYIKYEYSFDKRKYIGENEKLFGVYRINLLDNCEKLKEKNEVLWNEYNKNNYPLYVNISNSKILISNNLFKIGTSLFLSILFEIQGVIITLVIVVSSALFYDLIRR
ncbi:hypothetical protein F9230_01740 [Acinetobacter johnsonii]|uniref:hypothetical protein n=1 Tax=Acinetobacter johnsonii TaxID=40214 RepID=UPI001F1F35C1|nr:hypothetical protein [Acinetobacter johnsonii]UJA03189.1 hypothetical protein F9230_01740 [Acinetobacter johnsonii]